MFSFLLGKYLPVEEVRVLGPQSVGSHIPVDPQSWDCFLVLWDGCGLKEGEVWTL